MPFDRQPHLRGTLLDVRPLVAADYRPLYGVAADPAVWEQHPEHDRHREVVFARFFDEALASGGALTVRDVADGRVIGSSRFGGCDECSREVEIGWTFLACSHWGGAYNGELKRLMLRHAFASVDVVVFLVDPGNVRSQRAIERIGAVRSGWRADASGRPSLLYRIDAATWAGRA